MIPTVGASVSSATLAVLFGLHGEVSANEEAIAMLHQLILLCNVTKHRQDSTPLNSCSRKLAPFFSLSCTSVPPRRCGFKLCPWLLVSQDPPSLIRHRAERFVCDESAAHLLSDSQHSYN